jgi:hypothetical protein
MAPSLFASGSNDSLLRWLQGSVEERHHQLKGLQDASGFCHTLVMSAHCSSDSGGREAGSGGVTGGQYSSKSQTRSARWPHMPPLRQNVKQSNLCAKP